MTLTGPFAVSVETVFFFSLLFILFIYFIYLFINLFFLILLHFYKCVTNCLISLFCQISILAVFLFTFCFHNPRKQIGLSVCLSSNNPGKVMTIYDLPALVAIAYTNAVTPSNIQAGFKSTRIYPFNSPIFSESDFLPGYVTDHDLYCQQLEKQERLPTRLQKTY